MFERDVFALASVVTERIRKLTKSAGKCDSLPWEGAGRGFYAKLLRMISQRYHSSRNPYLPFPEEGIAQGHGLHDLFPTPAAEETIWYISNKPSTNTEPASTT
ncbi:MAG: hypothetical protein JWR09_2498 [Mucilaginibacter sp.]|nr:hypothetical protein [Mucilaginibacter sp.]